MAQTIYFDEAEAYDARGIATVEQQIAKAGKRLARVLNGAFR